MSVAGAAPLDARLSTPRTAPAWLAATRTTDLCLGLFLATLWALAHTYVGIEGDSRIYMGRALADLDPGGVGRDIMFAMDGQSSFSLYRILARTLAAGLGFGTAVALLSVLNVVAWFAAAATLARVLVPGRAIALVLGAVCVLPRLYTPWHLLAAGEGIAIPRPLAEAGVMLALAALCRGRPRLAAAALVGAAAFHPIMAAPGFAVLLVVLGLRDRRWYLGATVLAGAGIGAGLLGLPLASRLAVTIDPAWFKLLQDRNIYLFLHRWPLDGLGYLAVQAATILIGCVWLAPPARTICLAAIGIAAAGCAASLALGDGLANLLVLQAQLWRALWLPAVLAPMAAGLCLWRLPSRGPTGQIALALLLLAWAAIDMVPLGPVAAVLALAACFGGPRLSFSVGRTTVRAVWAGCVLLALVSEWSAVQALAVIVSKMPAGMAVPANIVWSLGLPAIPALLAVWVAWRWPRAPAVRLAAPLVAAAGVVALVATFDMRTAAHADSDAARVRPDLVAMLASRPGEVLWTDSDDAWYWARRPNWNGMTQGGGIVFSRDLAMTWRDRARAMFDAGLASAAMLTPGQAPATLTALHLDGAEVQGFCRRAGAPAWIVASLEPGDSPPAGLDATIWTPAAGHWKLYVGDGAIRWRHLDRYAVIPCAPSK